MYMIHHKDMISDPPTDQPNDWLIGGRQCLWTLLTELWSTICAHRTGDRLGCEELAPPPLHWHESHSQNTTSLWETLSCHPPPSPPLDGVPEGLRGGTTIVDHCPEQGHAPAADKGIISQNQAQPLYKHPRWHRSYLHICNIVAPMKRTTVLNHSIEGIQNLILSRLHHQWVLKCTTNKNVTWFLWSIKWTSSKFQAAIIHFFKFWKSLNLVLLTYLTFAMICSNINSHTPWPI